MKIAVPFNSINTFLMWLDQRANRFFSQLGSTWAFLTITALFILTRLFKPKAVPKRHIIRQLESAGVDSMPIIVLVAFLIGVTLVLQSVFVLETYGQKDLVAGLVSITLCRELGPLLTAVIFTGRVGAAYTAELGTMKVSEEILALETMGISPIGYLVVPRFLAGLIALPCLTVLADFVGIFAGFITAQNFDISGHTYIEITRQFLQQKDFVFGIVKSFFFAIVIITVACYKGFTVEGGGSEVGRATMEAVVISLVAVIFSDTVFTMIFNIALADKGGAMTA